MALTDLFARARRSAEYRRAKHNARADQDFLAGLVRLRIESGKSQSEIADLLGVSQQSVSKFERYDNDPKLSTVRQYADAVGALVCHTVDQDRGQLENGALRAVTVVAQPTVHGFIARQNPGTYTTPSQTRARWAIAA